MHFTNLAISSHSGLFFLMSWIGVYVGTYPNLLENHYTVKIFDVLPQLRLELFQRLVKFLLAYSNLFY